MYMGKVTKGILCKATKMSNAIVPHLTYLGHLLTCSIMQHILIRGNFT